MAYFGQTPLHIGILVAFTQAIPEHQIQLFLVFTARVKVRYSPVFLTTLAEGDP